MTQVVTGVNEEVGTGRWELSVSKNPSHPLYLVVEKTVSHQMLWSLNNFTAFFDGLNWELGSSTG